MVNKKNNLFSVIIVNWNSGNYLYNCIQSIKLNEPQDNYDIIIIDNASTDNSLEKISKTKGIQIIKLKQNEGFAKACNIGSKLSSSEYLLFLNPDTTIFKKTISNTVKTLQNLSKKKIGIAGIQLLNSDNNISKSCWRFPTTLTMICKILNLEKLLPKYTSGLMIEFDFKNSKIVDQVMGAFFLVSSELFYNLKGFDESFFVYKEEVDFSLRAKKKGYSSIFISKYKAFHAGGGCSSKNKSKRLFYYLRSNLIYTKKHFSIFSFILIFIFTLIIEPLARFIDKIIKGRFFELEEVINAYKYLLKWIFRFLIT